MHFCFAVPAEQPVISDEVDTERTLVVGPYTEGSSLTLHCEANGGNIQVLIFISCGFAENSIDLEHRVLATCEPSNKGRGR
jgi:hypothetical protein